VRLEFNLRYKNQGEQLTKEDNSFKQWLQAVLDAMWDNAKANKSEMGKFIITVEREVVMDLQLQIS